MAALTAKPSVDIYIIKQLEQFLRRERLLKALRDCTLSDNQRVVQYCICVTALVMHCLASEDLMRHFYRDIYGREPFSAKRNRTTTFPPSYKRIWTMRKVFFHDLNNTFPASSLRFIITGVPTIKDLRHHNLVTAAYYLARGTIQMYDEMGVLNDEGWLSMPCIPMMVFVDHSRLRYDCSIRLCFAIPASKEWRSEPWSVGAPNRL